jgi:hypothetical protein
MPKQAHQANDFKGKILSGLTVLSLVSVPFVWRMPNILPLVSVGGLVSSSLYYRKVGYRPSKLEKQFIETHNKLSEQAQQLKSDREILNIEKTNLKSNFDKWRDEELVRIEQIRKNRLDDAEKIIQSKLSEVEELAKSKIAETHEWIAQQRRELERRGQDLIDREESLEQRALAIAEQIKQAEAESIKRVEEREAAGLAEFQEKVGILEAYRQQLEKDRQALEQEKVQLIEEVQAVERQWEQKWLEQEERHQEDYKQLEQVYSNVAGSYAAENWALKRPDYFDPPTNTEEYAANDVMKLLAQHDIFAKAPILKSDDRGFRLGFKVLPVKHKVKGEEITEKSLSAGEAYKIISGKLLPDLATVVPGCESSPKVSPTYQGLEIYFDTTGVNWEEVEAKLPDNVHEPSKNIFDLFKRSYHLGLVGGTGRGKTTTTDNLLGAATIELGRENVEIKVSAGKPDESLRKYKCVVSNEKGLLLLKEAADLIEERLQLHIREFEAGKPLTKFDKKIIYFFDEISDLAQWAHNLGDPSVVDFLMQNDFPLDKKGNPVSNVVGLLLKRCWRLGRSLGIMIIIAGQNLMPSQLGVNTTDLLNMGMLYLGTSSKSGIEERGTSRGEKNYLLRQYGMRVKAGQEFFGLFSDAAGDSWLASLPSPGEYSAWEVVTQAGQEFEGGLGEDDQQNRLRMPNLPNLDPDNPDDIAKFQASLESLKRKPDESLGKVEPKSSFKPRFEGLVPWKLDADPTNLVKSAEPQIISLIREGRTKPSDIVKAIWGEVDFRSRPYNGKSGVKTLIEKLVKDLGSKQ